MVHITFKKILKCVKLANDQPDFSNNEKKTWWYLAYTWYAHKVYLIIKLNVYLIHTGMSITYDPISLVCVCSTYCVLLVYAYLWYLIRSSYNVFNRDLNFIFLLILKCTSIVVFIFLLAKSVFFYFCLIFHL